MPYIPYLPQDLSEPREVVDAIRARRRGTLLNLDRMLLYSPPFAEGWNSLMGKVRGELSLPARLRELAICTVGAVAGVEYEVHHHAPIFVRLGGTEAQVAALRARPDPDLSAFAPDDRAVVRLAWEMTRGVKPSREALDAARDVLGDDRRLVELLAVIAAYNMAARVLGALEVEPE